MVMADAPQHDPAGSGAGDGLVADAAPPAAAALSWAERETLDALKRLARARSQVQALEVQLVAIAAPIDPVDDKRLVEIHGELVQARSKAAGRFGRASARERVDQLEASERLLLEHLGLADYDAYLVASAPLRSDKERVDLQALAFARQELVSARQAWLDVQAMAEPELPEPGFDDAGSLIDGPDVA